MERHNQWMSYSFDDVEYGKKTDPNSIFKIHFNNKIDKLPSYKDALFNNAKIMRDSYNEPFDVMLSGGVDSEMVVRTFHAVGIKHNTCIFRLENNYNIRDVEYAVALCNELNISYKIIDFNVQKFFENDALDLFQKTLIPRSGRLVRLEWFKYLDNIPVFCDGEPYWRRDADKDFSKKSTWRLILNEDGYSCSTYARSIGRIAIGDWYEYTPELLLSYNELPLVKKLLNDEIPGKISSWSSRSAIHRDIWPSVQDKIKLVGYEGKEGYPASRPDFMNEFQLKYMSRVSNDHYDYTEEELRSLILK